MSVGDTCVRDIGEPGASGLGCSTAAPPGLRFDEPPASTAAGDFNLRLAAPGAGNQGSLGIGATVPAWIRFDWSAGAPGDENPAGQATFGIFGGDARQIYTRELY